MRVAWPKVWRAAKVVLAVLIVGGVAWQFAKILRRPELWAQPLRPDFGWLALAAAAYMAAFCFWGSFWVRLVRGFGQPLPWLAGASAYFASQLGKYVPGKALAIVLRVAFARSAGVRTEVGVITALYETLTSMAAGALVAAILIPILKSDQSALGWKALGLLAIAGVPILPGVFNRLAARAAKPFLPKDAPPLPRLRISTLAGGIVQTAVGWFFLGASLLAVLLALRPDSVDVSAGFWLVCTAYVAVAYVAGFIALPTPGGLGVREVIMQTFLAAELAPRLGEESEPLAVLVVLLLRLVWTVTELSLAAGCFAAHRLSKARP
ncbi:MAG: lysylphosphatidylglycerol synthase domain-containing protein [Gemmataceae bacterium]